MQTASTLFVQRVTAPPKFTHRADRAEEDDLLPLLIISFDDIRAPTDGLWIRNPFALCAGKLHRRTIVRIAAPAK